MVFMMDPVAQSLHDVLNSLKGSVESLNSPANLDGLLAIHFDINSRLDREFGWHVYCDPASWMQQNEVDLTQSPYLAILGCLLAEQVRRFESIDKQAATAFVANLGRIQQRQSVFSLPNSWALQPDVVLGIALGIRAVSNLSSTTWMLSLVEEGLKRPDMPLFIRMIYEYVQRLLSKQPFINFASSWSMDSLKCSISELAFAIWFDRYEAQHHVSSENSWLNSAYTTLIRRLTTEPPYETQDYKAAVIWLIIINHIDEKSAHVSQTLLSDQGERQMTRKSDLEKHIRESYQIIRECEDIVRLSNDPKERLRNQRTIEEQQRLIQGYLNEYQPLCQALNQPPPEDVAQIIIIISSGKKPSVPDPVVAEPAKMSQHGIPSVLLHSIRQTLMCCDEFSSQRQLYAVMGVESLRPWQAGLPGADSLSERVDLTINHLAEKYRASGENALVLLLQTLGDRYDPADERHTQLLKLAGQLELSLSA